MSVKRKMQVLFESAKRNSLSAITAVLTNTTLPAAVRFLIATEEDKDFSKHADLSLYSFGDWTAGHDETWQNLQ